MNVKTLGIDLAKETFQLHGVDASGKAVLKKKLKRIDLMQFIVMLPKCRIIMESCATSNYWGRKFQALGHEVQLISAQFVKPFVKSQKNDRNDAEAIVEAGSRPAMRYVAVKAVWQQDIQALHRARKRAIRGRTAIINQTKGLLAEYGVVIKERANQFRLSALECVEDAENELSAAMRLLVSENIKEYEFLVHQIKMFDREIEQIANQSEDCERLMAIPGVGVLGATAFISSIGDPSLFKNGRQVGSWIGLVPKQHSTGGVARLLSITKRGDPELRALLIHGARATLVSMMKKKKKDPTTEWALNLLEKKGWNKASVALANKTVRVMWHILKHKEEFKLTA